MVKTIHSFRNQELLNHWKRITSDDMTELLTWLRGGADKSLARPTARCRRTESIVSFGKRVLFMCRIASLLLSQGLNGSMSGDTRYFNNMET